jgi:hypothetical protein
MSVRVHEYMKYECISVWVYECIKCECIPPALTLGRLYTAHTLLTHYSLSTHSLLTLGRLCTFEDVVFALVPQSALNSHVHEGCDHSVVECACINIPWY